MKALNKLYKAGLKISAVIIIAIFLCQNSSLSYAGEINERAVPNVIIIVLSGVRNSETIEDPTHQYINHLWNDIFKEGVVYTNLVPLNFEFHIPAFNAIVSGFSHRFLNKKVGTRGTSLFQYARKEYGLPMEKVISVGHWFYNEYFSRADKLGPHTYPCELSVVSSEYSPQMEKIFTSSEAHFFDTLHHWMRTGIGNFPFSYLYWDSLGEITFKIFKRALQIFKPKLALFFMMSPDSAHYGTYGRYVQSVAQGDEMIYEVWKLIQEDPFYKDTTYLIICPDHGRDLDFMTHADDNGANPSPVWLYVYGPRIKKGITIRRPVYHVDIFATVASILHLKVHSNQGRVLKDCFR